MPIKSKNFATETTGSWWKDVHHNIVHKKKAPLTVAIFLVLIIAATTGLAGIMVCALTAVLALIVTGCLPLKEAYRALQANVLMLIVGTIALGTAMEQTGASRYYADLFLGLFQGWGPTLVLCGFMVLTSISTHVLSNNATAVLLLPIALSAAAGLGVDSRPFIIAICLGASACFATPIGYQTNLLVYGPGGYRFSDYVKLGDAAQYYGDCGGDLVGAHFLAVLKTREGFKGSRVQVKANSLLSLSLRLDHSP